MILTISFACAVWHSLALVYWYFNILVLLFQDRHTLQTHALTQKTRIKGALHSVEECFLYSPALYAAPSNVHRENSKLDYVNAFNSGLFGCGAAEAFPFMVNLAF